MNDTQNCPDPKELRGFFVGKMELDRWNSVASHLDGCEDCQETISGLGDVSDTLIEHIRINQQVGQKLDSEEMQRLISLARKIPQKQSSNKQKPGSQVESVLELGSTLGQYEILETIGHGGMGMVYKARHTRMKRLVAIKVIKGQNLSNKTALARFEREIEAVAQLDHPNIVRALDADEAKDVHYLAMEYVDGCDLSSLVKRDGMLSVANACELIKQAARGLAHIHDKRLVHRDIKPHNILLSSTGEAKILDLGLAVLGQSRPDESGLTSTGQVVGTVDYISPEQARNISKADIRSDIYSLGCTLYCLLAGRAPFSKHGDGSPLNVLMAHVGEPVPPLGQFRNDIPAELAAIVETMLQKDPAQRYANPADVAKALDSFTTTADLVALYRNEAPSVSDSAIDATVLEALPAEPSTMDISTQTKKKETTAVRSQVQPAASPRGDKVPPFQRIAIACIAFGFLAMLGGILFKFVSPGGTIVLSGDPQALEGAQISINGEDTLIIKLEENEKKYEFHVDEERGKIAVTTGAGKVWADKFEFQFFDNSLPFTVELEPNSSQANNQSAFEQTEGLDRDIARWVLEQDHGTVRLVVGSNETEYLTQLSELPSRPFHVTGIKIPGPLSPITDAVLARFGRLSKLRTIYDGLSGITDQGCAHISGLKELEILHLRGPVTDNGVAKLRNLKKLKILLIESGNLTDACLVHLKDMAKLQTLNVGQLDVTSKGLTPIASLTELRHLGFSGKNVTDDDLKHLVPLKNLVSLGITDSRLTGTGFRHLRHLPIGTLSMSADQLTKRGVQEMARLPKLANVGFYGSTITDDMLAECQHAKGLQIMNLQDTTITGEGFKSFGELEHLRGIRLENSNVTDTGLRHLRNLKHLRNVYLNETGISDETLKHLEQLPKLEIVDLTDTQVTSAGVASLKQALPECNVIWNGPETEAPKRSTNEPIVIKLPKPLPKLPAIVKNRRRVRKTFRGLVLDPAQHKGIKHWQIETVAPRSNVVKIAWSPDDKLLACGTYAGMVRVYDTETGQLLHIQEGHPQELTDLAWSPTSSAIVSTGFDGTVRLWNIKDQTVRDVGRPVAPASCVDWNPSGKQFAEAREDNKIRIWNSDAKLVLEIDTSELGGRPRSIDWHPGGDLLAASCSDKKIGIWNVDGTLRDVIEEAGDDVAWSPDGKNLVWTSSQAAGHRLRLWDSGTKQVRTVYQTTIGQLYSPNWSPDGQRIVFSEADRPLCQCNVDGSDFFQADVKLKNITESVSYSHDGSRIASGSGDGAIRLFDNGGEILSTLGGVSANISDMDWSPDGVDLAAVNHTNTFRLWKNDGLTGLIVGGHNYKVHGVDWKENNQAVVSVGRSIRTWKRDGSPLLVFEPKEYPHGGVSYRPSHNQIVSLPGIWDGTTGEKVKHVDVPREFGRPQNVSWSPDGKYFAVSDSADRRLRILDETGDVISQFNDKLSNVSWSPDGKWIANWGGAYYVTLMTPDGKTSRVITSDSGNVIDMTWSPDGKYLVTGTSNNRLKIWQTNTLPGPALKGRLSDIHKLDWSSTGKIAVCNGLGQIGVWDAATQEPLWSAVITGPISNASFSADGKILYDGESVTPEDEDFYNQMLIYVVENKEGKRELFTPKQFQKRTGQSIWKTAPAR